MWAFSKPSRTGSVRYTVTGSGKIRVVQSSTHIPGSASRSANHALDTRNPSPAILADAFRRSGAGVATVSLRRESGTDRAGQEFWKLINDLGVLVLPNTAGCHSVKEAVTTAHMAREMFDTKWIKLEVIGEDDTLQPDVFGLVEAAKILTDEGFQVFPYTTEDLVVADKLLNAGCEVLMPWGAPDCWLIKEPM